MLLQAIHRVLKRGASFTVVMACVFILVPLVRMLLAVIQGQLPAGPKEVLLMILLGGVIAITAGLFGGSISRTPLSDYRMNPDWWGVTGALSGCAIGFLFWYQSELPIQTVVSLFVKAGAGSVSGAFIGAVTGETLRISRIERPGPTQPNRRP